jgi:hypothetical protein
VPCAALCVNMVDEVGHVLLFRLCLAIPRMSSRLSILAYGAGTSAGARRPCLRQPVVRSQVRARATGGRSWVAACASAPGGVPWTGFQPSNHRAEEAGSSSVSWPARPFAPPRPHACARSAARSAARFAPRAACEGRVHGTGLRRRAPSLHDLDCTQTTPRCA